MTAMGTTDTSRLTGLVTDRVTNTNTRAYKTVVVEDAAVATGETLDLATIDASITGIIGPIVESFAGAKSSTASTWSSTTITLPAHPHTVYQSAWLCY
jgi:hypothetical protein